MEALYSLGLEIHTVGVIVLLAVVMFNIMMLALSREVIRYSKRMRIVMPTSASLIAVAIFTGAIMMAAKHLNFTFANVSMIVVSILLIVLEAKRYRILKRQTDIKQENAFAQYKVKAFRLLGIELLLLLVMFGWMLR